MTDPYTTLGVSRTATADEVTRAYRDQLRTHHPDSRSGATDSGPDDHLYDDHLQQVLAAYALLRDPARRARYDRSHVARDRTSGTSITVRRAQTGAGEPPLRAGPACWHRTR